MKNGGKHTEDPRLGSSVLLWLTQSLIPIQEGGQLLELSNTGARLNGCYSKAHALVLELIYYKQNQKASEVKP